MMTKKEAKEQAIQILSELTLDEKLAVMDGDAPFWHGLADMTGGGYADHPWVAGAIPRFDIPGVRFADGPRGVVLAGATTFPVTIARGAAWDTELEERVGDVIGKELRALGANFFGGVCINLLRHPAWGRAQETYGEDPFHLGELGAALARGVQRHAMACVKHFAVNSMENARFKLDVQIGARALHEMYLPHFKRVIDEGVAAVMSAYNSVNGEWCGQSAELLTDILKERWGFEGFVISDFIFGMRDAKTAALAGQDVEMPFQMLFHENLKALVENGEVPLARIDDAVLRVLHQQLLRVRPGSYPAELAGCENHRGIAREVAQKSIVLLKNESGLLPLGAVKRLAVIGRLADAPNTGDTASSSTRPAHVVTALEGIRSALDKNTELLADDGTDLEQAKATASAADAAIVVVGYTNEDEGEFIDTDTVRELASLFPPPTASELPLAAAFMDGLSGDQVGSFPPGGDRDHLTLRAEDEDLIRSIVSVQSHVVVVVVGGSAVIMENWREHVPAILMLWYPGMEGGHALADVLFGRVNPSGRLPIAIPRLPEHLSAFDKNATTCAYDLWHGYRLLERQGHPPAFAFGYGLSYTKYRYANLRLSKQICSPADTLTVTLDITNEGGVAGEDIVQLYVTPVNSAVERAPRELKAFARTALGPGETKQVDIALPISRLAYFDETVDDFIVEAIAYHVFVGSHSLDEHALHQPFHVQSEAGVVESG